MQFSRIFLSFLVLICASCALSSCARRTILSEIGDHNLKHKIDIERSAHSAIRTIRESKEKILPKNSEMDVWFVRSNQGEMALVPVQRSFGASSINLAIKALLDGPSASESHTGLGSEIPRGTILLGIHEIPEGIELDLSKRFASGGGASSMEARLEQLSRTITPVAGGKPVFLAVEGKRLSMTPGEGIEVKQPINR